MPAASIENAISQGRQIGGAEQERVASSLHEFSQFQVVRSAHALQWEETASLILPTSSNTFFYGNVSFPGQKKTQQQIDATGGLALHRFCAIADSLVTPRNQQWHGLTAGGRNADYIMKDRATKLWFENTTRKLFKARYAAHSGFSGQNYNNWQSTGAFGNSTMFIDKLDGRTLGGAKGLRYKAVPLGETFFGESHQGKVDRMFRWFRRTPYQAAQQWGMDALPQSLLTPLKNNSQWLYNFLHCVKPRDDYDPERLDARAMPYTSYYISIEGQCLMGQEKGFGSFPFAVSRYDQTPGEVYGRGWAQIVLPALKTLNAQKTTFLKAGHRAADPVLLTADDGIVGMSLRPGAMNKGGVTADGKPLVHTLPVGDIQITKEMMAEEKEIVNDTALVSLFKVLTDHPSMTATQVIELVNEKGMLVAPTLGRQHADYVGQMVPREVNLMAEMGELDPMPPRLREARGEYEVVDTSPIAMAARAGEAAGFFRTLESVKELVNITQDPSPLDNFNFDAAVPEISETQNVPIRWMNDERTKQGIRQARAKSQAQQQQIQAMPAQAAMMKAQAVVNKNQPGVSPGQAFGGPQQQPGA